MQGNVFIRSGPLLVGGIAPTNSGPGRIKTLPLNKVSTCRKALYLYPHAMPIPPPGGLRGGAAKVGDCAGAGQG